MSYDGIGFVNNNPPAINAENLNKMDNELVKLDKASYTINLFDIDADNTTNGFYTRANVFATNDILRSTDYITVIPGCYYYTNLNANSYILWYNSNKQFISYTDLNNGAKVVAVNNAAYARFMFREAEKNDFYVGLSNSLTEITTHINNSDKVNKNLFNITNLFDVNGNNTTTGFYDRTNTLVTNATLRSTELIAVLAGGYYYTNLESNSYVLWYDVNKSFIGYTDITAGEHVQVIDDAYYARFIFTEAIKNNFIVAFFRSYETISENIGKNVQELNGIGQFNRVSNIYVNSLPTSDGYYWGNGGKTAYPGFVAVRDTIQVNPGDVIILNDWGKAPNASSACIAMYAEDGSDAPGRVNYNDTQYVKSYVFENRIVKYARIVIPTGCYRIGLFYVSSGFSGSPYFTKNTYRIVLTNDFKEAILEEINVEVEEEKAPKYFLKGNANKLARTKKLCIIGAGQSNMDGRVPVAQLPSYITLPLAGMKFIKNDLSGVFGDGFTVPSGLWAFDLVTCYYLIQNLGQDELYYIKWSEGGTAIDPAVTPSTNNDYWTPDYEQLPSLSNSLLYQYNSEIQKCNATNSGDYEIGAMIWHQGEQDSLNWHGEENYYENFKNVISFCRGIANNACLPFIFGTIPLVSSGYSMIIDAAQRKIAEEDDYVFMVDLANAQLLDFAHMNADWCEYFGKKVYDCLIDAKVITGQKLNPQEPQ